MRQGGQPRFQHCFARERELALELTGLTKTARTAGKERDEICLDFRGARENTTLYSEDLFALQHVDLLCTRATQEHSGDAVHALRLRRRLRQGQSKKEALHLKDSIETVDDIHCTSPTSTRRARIPIPEPYTTSVVVACSPQSRHSVTAPRRSKEPRATLMLWLSEKAPSRKHEKPLGEHQSAQLWNFKQARLSFCKKTKRPIPQCFSVFKMWQLNIIGTTGAKQNNLTEDQKRKVHATFEDGFAKTRALTQLEILLQRLPGTPCGHSADQQLYGKN